MNIKPVFFFSPECHPCSTFSEFLQPFFLDTDTFRKDNQITIIFKDTVNPCESFKILMHIFNTFLDPVNRSNIKFAKTKTGEWFPEHVSPHQKMQWLRQIRSNQDAIHK